jgi:hypothetical protein
MVAVVDARTGQVRDTIAGIVREVAAASERGAGEVRAAMEALDQSGTAISAAGDTATARMRQALDNMMQEVTAASERGAQQIRATMDALADTGATITAASDGASARIADLQAATGAAANEMNRAGETVQLHVIQLAQISETKTRLEAWRRCSAVIALRDTGGQVAHQSANARRFRASCAFQRRARRWKRRPARRLRHASSRLCCRTRPSVPPSPMARSSVMSSGFMRQRSASPGTPKRWPR